MIIAAIGARCGSKGIRDKNIQTIGPVPLLAYSILVAKKVPSIKRVIVSSDSEAYLRIAREYGAETLLRPSEMARDESPDYPWLSHLLEWAGSDSEEHLIVLLRPTTPFREPRLITKAIKWMQLKKEATSLRSVEEMEETAWKSFYIENKNYLYPLSRDLAESQDYPINPDLPRHYYPKTYHPNGYVDIIRSRVLSGVASLYGHKILAFETPSTIEIDTPEQLEFARWKYNQGAYNV